MDAGVRLTVGLLLLMAVFWAIERLFGLPGDPEAPGDPAARRILGVRRDTWTDVVYWFVTPVVTRTITFAGVALAVAVLTVGAGDGIDALVAGSVVGTQPRWLQAIEVLVVLDFMGYWFHRAFHRGRLWPFHAVHHGPRRVTWLTSVRLHPVNDLVPRVAQVMLLLALGFDPAVLAGAVPALAFYTLLLHARVPWRFGALRFVFASPAFHRWHHAAQADGRGHNFAGFLPIWDLLFGTYYVPQGAQPRQFGAPGEAVPEGFWAQMVWPFRRSRAAASAGMLARDVPPPPAQ